jgi:ribosome-associated protein
MRNNLAREEETALIVTFNNANSHTAEREGIDLVERNADPTVAELIRACEDGKGIDIRNIDVRERFGLADNFIVVSGRSDRHVQGIAYRILKVFEDRGMEPFSVQGLEDGQWIVIDASDVVVHIFYEPLRAHYDLEGLWA